MSELPKVLETNEIVALFDIAGFTTAPAALSPDDLVQALQAYLDTIFRLVERSGGVAVHLYGNAVMGTWPVSDSVKDRERVGHAACEALAMVSQIALRGGIKLQPRISLASGPVLRSDLLVAGRPLPVSIGATMNFAMRLNSLCANLKKRILFPASLPVIWPKAFTTEEVQVIAIKGGEDHVQLLSLCEETSGEVCNPKV